MDAKSSGWQIVEERDIHSSQNITPQTAYYLQREKSTLIMERSCRYDIDLARPLLGQSDIMCLLSCDAVGRTHHQGIYLAKKYLTKSNHEETTGQIQVVGHKTAGVYSSKMSTLWETKRSWRNCSRLKENKDYKFNGWPLVGSWSVLTQL